MFFTTAEASASGNFDSTFGSNDFRNYRIRALLYVGQTNWELLATITPR
jgi:hypothetical protein